MPEPKIKVLIADDSPVVREILKDMIKEEEDLEVVAEARNGKDAVELAASLKPDIITMDVMMPVMNGLEAVEEIMAYNPTPILVFSSAVNDKEMDVAFQAIARGALDVLEKPRISEGVKFDGIRADFLSKLRMLSHIHVIPHIRGKKKRRETHAGADPSQFTPPGPRPRPEIAEAPPEAPRPEKTRPKTAAAPYDMPLLPGSSPHRKLMAVGASTGGPKALVHIFKRIPAGFPVPILVVQHIAHSFAPGLVAWLDRESPLRVVLGEDRARPAPGIIYISPTGVHMILEKGLIRLTDTPPLNSCRPSVDCLFSSVAAEMRELCVGALLTGMGRDGAEGLLAIKKQNGLALIQDEASSVIFGMPRAAMEIGAYHDIVSLYDFPAAIVQAAWSKPAKKDGRNATP